MTATMDQVVRDAYDKIVPPPVDSSDRVDEKIYGAIKEAVERGWREGWNGALEDAAKGQERLAKSPRALGSKAVEFKRMLFAAWLRDRMVL